jgi:argininosuccinate lyase
MTELADALVRVEKISFRTAHEIVAEAIVIAINERKIGNEMTKMMLDEAAMRVAKRTLTISDDEIRSFLDPIESVRRRIVKGGPSPGEVRRMINDRLLQISNEQGRLNQRKSELERAYDVLAKRVEAII